MASAFVVCVLLAIAADGAVLDTQDTLLRRIVRSPGCDKCSDHPHLPPPPPPPPPFVRGPPPGFHSEGASSQASNFKEAGFSRYHNVGEFQQNTFNSGSLASAHAVAGQHDKFHKEGFSGNQQVEGGSQQNGFSASAHAVSGIAGSSHNSKNGFAGTQQNLGNGFRQTGFNAGSSASAKTVTGIGGGFDKHSAKYGVENQKTFGSGFEKNGFNTGSAASAQTGRGVAGSYDKFEHKEGSSGNQALGVQQNGQAVGGAFENLKQAPKLQADKQGCNSCDKGGSAVSNAKSHSGSATAIAVNNG